MRAPIGALFRHFVDFSAGQGDGLNCCSPREMKYREQCVAVGAIAIVIGLCVKRQCVVSIT